MSLISKYYDSLCRDIGVDPEAMGVESICALLMVSPFTAVLEDDENAIESALYIRREYARDMPGADKQEFYRALGPCSVFEIMHILISEMSYKLIGNPLASSDPGVLFLELIDNLDLGWVDDRAFAMDAERCSDYVEDVVSTFVNRDYDFYGQDGGLFPVNETTYDMRKKSLFAQLDTYLIDRYDALGNRN